MKTFDTHRTNRRGLVALVALVSLLAAVFGIMSGAAQSQQADRADDGRKFENTIPEHVPIKVKLKSEKSFKDLKNKNWARELEIEVKNTGDKPIYYLYVIIAMPDPRAGGIG
ncbi:MAG TPA: hypothetical protein VM914_00770 [Pyrinomonadaceae bacterium]|jgi:hypothetical protein|nr:hypothetical protein [Pyrinomonadaceae bacterium]